MIDIIKEFILNQFAGPVTIPMIVTSLLVAFVMSLFIVFVYRKTFSGIVADIQSQRLIASFREGRAGM